ncbi:MAG: hypothetical protein ACREQB_09650 [Candidatus Binataceae bacterium]
MNGYQYLIARNRLMIELEAAIAKLSDLPQEQRQRETRGLELEFDRKLADLYAQMSDEYPGERRKKARPLTDPR